MKEFEKEISVVILAGGEGRRMGGQDKGLIPYHGRPLIEHVLEAVPAQVAALLVSANRNLETYRQYGQVICDEAPGYAGPLAGILAALHNAHTPYLLVLPCDTPKLPRDLLSKLYTALSDQKADIAIANNAGRRHHVIVLLKTSLADDLQEYLAGGERRVGDWLKRHKFVDVLFEGDGEYFANINQPDLLQ